ncbi:MAG: lipid-A-disaccharide synthase [Gammaproteobacteria bacterium WSBS_2016_MAG_OTU1]
MTDVILSAGEASGDALGAALATQLRRLIPNIKIAGIGADKMQQAGVELIASCAPLSVMGYWDVAVRLPSILALRRQLLAEIHRRRPTLFIGIDAPDFNLGVAAAARQSGIKTVQYVAPSIWMWREKRINKIRQAVDAVWCLLPFEPAIYKKLGVAAEFVGHPLASMPQETKTTARKQLNIADDCQLIALMPGSRATELNLHLPLFAETIKLLQAPRRKFIALAADDSSAKQIRDSLPFADVQIANSMQILAAADAGLIKSGTSALQAALTQTPMLIVYKMSAVAYMLGDLRDFYLPFFGLPNILSGRFVVPELLQEHARADNVAKQMEKILTDENKRNRQIAAMAKIRQSLSAVGDDAAAKAAAAML